MTIATTPEPPYWAVIFTSRRTLEDGAGYAAMADEMERLALVQPGCLGAESARNRDGLGITVSYWSDEVSIAAWKSEARHLVAQQLGRERWYTDYAVRVAKVERAYGSG